MFWGLWGLSFGQPWIYGNSGVSLGLARVTGASGDIEVSRWAELLSLGPLESLLDGTRISGLRWCLWGLGVSFWVHWGFQDVYVLSVGRAGSLWPLASFRSISGTD